MDKTIIPEKQSQFQADKTVVADGADKTIVAANNTQQQADKTVVAGGADKTIVAEGSSAQQPVDKTVVGEGNKTIVAGEGNKTVVAGRTVVGGSPAKDKNKPAMQKSAGVNVSINIEAKSTEIDAIMDASNIYHDGVKLTIDGAPCKILSTISDTSGEACVYKVEYRKRTLALKLYNYSHHLSTEQLSILHDINAAKDTGCAVELYLYGKGQDLTFRSIKGSSDTPAPNDIYFELMQYCEGGTLADICIAGNQNLFREYALKMAACIDFCHKKRFLHRDIKPANFFFVDKDQKRMVLGDFGIAAHLDSNGQCITNAARTKIYASPEIYINVPGEQYFHLYPESDFYSMGMVLLYLWYGKTQFNSLFADNNNNIDERVLANLKISGRLPLPTDLSPENLSLLKALLEVDRSKRASYDQIEQWAKGNNPFETVIQQTADEMDIVYTHGRHVHSMTELVKAMLEDRRIAAGYLYNGDISRWLREQDYPEYAMLVDELLKEYAKDRNAGVIAACYTLDPELPFIADDGSQYATVEDIASHMLHNSKRYENALKQENHSLYIYLKTGGQKQLAQQAYSDIKGNPHYGLLNLIYSLDVNQPFPVTIKSSGETVYCDTPADIVDARSTKGQFSSDTEDDIKSPVFLSWLGERDVAAQQRVIRFMKDYNTDAVWVVEGILYCFNLQYDFGYDIDRNSGSSVFTAQQVAEYLNKLKDVVLTRGENSDAAKGILEDLYDSYDSRFFVYLFSKGKQYEDKCHALLDCFDVNSEENRKKASDYNVDVALYKFIKALGYNPTYYFPAQDKHVSTLNELKTIPEKDVRLALNNGCLKEWIAVFFHEDPFADFSRKYSYEESVADYIEFIRSLDQTQPLVQNYDHVDNVVANVQSKVNNVIVRAKVIRLILGLIALIPIIFTCYSLLVHGLPFGGNPLKGQGMTVGLVLVILCSLVMLMEDGFPQGLIEGVIGGIVLYWILYAILALLMPVAPYLFVIVLLALGGLMIYMMFKSLQQNKYPRVFNPSFADLHLESVYNAFRPHGGVVDTPYLDDAKKFIADTNSSWQQQSLLLIPTALIAALALWLQYFLTGSLFGITFFTPEKDHHYELFAGDWNGEFDGRAATLQITDIKEDGSFSGVMNVKYKNLIKEKVNGKITPDSIVFTDLVQNGNLDGDYASVYERQDGNNYHVTGTYVNKMTGKTTAFNFDRVLDIPAEQETIEEEKTGNDVNETAETEQAQPQTKKTDEPAREPAKEVATPDPSSAKTKKREEPAVQPSKPTQPSSGKGGFKLEKVNPANQPSSGGGGFKLEKVNSANQPSSGGSGFKLEKIENNN